MTNISNEQVEEGIKRMIQILYNTTKYSSKDLDEHVFPYCSDTIEFVDAWQRMNTLSAYASQFKGLRNMRITFESTWDQFAFQYKDDKQGRMICEGWFTTTVWIPKLLSFPLRTICIMNFVRTQDEKGFVVYFHEEMWSFADLFEQITGIGTVYNWLRKMSSKLFAFGFGLFA